MKNELGAETSPYLLQHAGNPVHWQAWSPDALALAGKLDRPVLVSIGYSACHWCHVMERESFEDEATAALMNERFVNIKIDREERPDLDHIYMDAVQAMTGSGGWPLNVFLTPDGKPFYGGTYFPPAKAFNRPSWRDVLMSISDAWQKRRPEMLAQADTLTLHLQKSNRFTAPNDLTHPSAATPAFTREDCKMITANLLAAADTTHGGFGAAPKFPQTFSINCLLEAALFLQDEAARRHATLSLDKMLNGGIYDQLGGGISRYSTDGEWLAPHFEKMLYDNALLIVVLCNAYLLTKLQRFRAAVKDVCQFLFREMKSVEGGYYAALDADSEGEEGRFYVWTRAEICSIAGEDAAFFNACYDVTDAGNWEGKNILRITRPVTRVAGEFGLTVQEAESVLERVKIKLLAARNTRVRPGTDDKILLGWNALLVTAFCKIFAVTGEEIYRREATELFAFIENKFGAGDGKYFHTYKAGRARFPAFADDLAYLCEAGIHLQEITGNQDYLLNAKMQAAQLLKDFSDDTGKLVYFTPADQDNIAVRKIEVHDGAVPSANSILAKSLLYLSAVFDEREWYQRALDMIFSLKNIIIKYPGSFGIWASAGMNMAAGLNEIAVIGRDMMPELREVLLQYIPNKILQSADMPSKSPLLAEKAITSQTAIYLCRNFTCKEPFSKVSDLLAATEANRFGN